MSTAHLAKLSRRQVRRLRAVVAAATVVVAALAGLLALSVPADGHAVLVESEPADGQALEESPDAITLVFNEPVTVPSGGLRLYDSNGEQLPATTVDTGAPETVALAVPDALPDGGYVVTWRVSSADSHPIAGAFVFTVGAGDAVADDVVAALFGDQGSVLTGAVAGLLRGLGYAGTLLAAGALAFAVWIARREDDRSRARRLGVVGAWAAVAAGLLMVPVQAAATTGLGALALLQPEVASDTLGSSFGVATLLRLAALVALTVLWARRPADLRWLATPASLAVASFLVDGHTRTVEPMAVMLAGDALHLAAATVWFGGLVVLAASIRARSLEDDPVGAARLVARFSNLALWSVLLVAIGGVAMAWALVRVPRALVTTPYGWTLLAKNGLVLVVIAVAVYNRQRLVPAIARRLVPAGGAVDQESDTAVAVPARTRSAWRQLRTTVVVEVVLLVAILAVTGFLVSQRPAADAAGVTGVYETTVSLTDDLDADVVVDPNRAGRNTIHLYVLDRTGRPSDEVEDVRLELHYPPEDIGPFVREPFPAGPGHWVLTGDDLAFPGEWHIRIVTGLDRFTEVSAEVSVVVNR